MRKMRFPLKLYGIANDDRTNSIQWTNDGKAIVIRYKQFTQDYLQEDGLFKTRSISSFIRQLNLYGFRKERSRSSKGDVHRFSHKHFVRGCFSQIDLVKRTTGKNDLFHVRPKKKLGTHFRKHFKRPVYLDDESCAEWEVNLTGVKIEANDGGNDENMKKKRPNNEQHFDIEKADRNDEDDSGNISGGTGCFTYSANEECRMDSSFRFLLSGGIDKMRNEKNETYQPSEYVQNPEGFSSEQMVEDMQKEQSFEEVLCKVNPKHLNLSEIENMHFKETSNKSTMTSPIATPITPILPLGPYKYAQEDAILPNVLMPQNFITEGMGKNPDSGRHGIYREEISWSPNSNAGACETKLAMGISHNPRNSTETISVPETSTYHTPDEKNLTPEETTSVAQRPHCCRRTSCGSGANATNPAANLEFRGIQPRYESNENGILIYLPRCMMHSSDCAGLRGNSNILGDNTRNGNSQHPLLPAMMHSVHQNSFQLFEMEQIKGSYSSAARYNGDVGSYRVPGVDIHHQYLPYVTAYPYHFRGGYDPYDNMTFD